MKRFISALSSLCLAATAVFSAFPAQAAAANTVSAKATAGADAAEGTVVYRFVPDGQSSYSDTVKVEAGQKVKLNLTVENDPGTAGAQLYFKFDNRLTLAKRATAGDAYDASYEWNADDCALVWTCAEGHEQKAKDGAVIYSFTVTVPDNAADGTSYTVDLDKNNPKGVSVRPEGGVKEAADIPYEFYGVKLKVGDGAEPDTTAGGGSTQPPAGTVVYNFVPDGVSYTAGNPNTHNAKAGEKIKVNLTVKNDPGTAGGQIYFKVTNGLEIAKRATAGSAYEASFEWNADNKALVWTCTEGHNQKAKDNSVIYSFTVTIPEDAAKGSSYTIGLNKDRKGDVSIRPEGGVNEVSDIPFEFYDLKFNVTDGGSGGSDPTDAVIYNFVPDGASYTAGNPNVYKVEAGQKVKVNLTVKNDPGTAGAQMYFSVDSKLNLAKRATAGDAYEASFEWNADDCALV